MFILLKRLSAEYILKKIDEKFNLVEKENQILKLQQKIESMEIMLNDIHYQITNKKNYCPICNNYVDEFLPFGVVLRENALCPICGSLERHRLIYLYLKAKTSIFNKNVKMLHIAPEKILANVFRKYSNIDYLPTDLDKTRPMIKEEMDIQNIQYPDNSFDVIFCSHVLEHVPDDKKAMSELHRVLKPEGSAIIMVPINHSYKTTYDDPSINTPELRKEHYGISEHLRVYGLDFLDKLQEAGFNSKIDNYINEFTEETIRKYGLLKSDDIFVCTK